VASTARKPLSIAFEEIAADKIVARRTDGADPDVRLADDLRTSSHGDRARGRRIVLGVTGGIAAYKAVEVCRRLVDAGAHVSPVLTKGALHFVGETTFSALASEPVQRTLWDEDSPIPHTRLGQGADLVLVCPATAKVISDYAPGGPTTC
jgi:hypothetical protein